MRVEVFPSLGALPEAYSRLFDAAGRESLYQSYAWYQNLLETTTDEGDEVRLSGVEESAPGREPLALFVARSPRRRAPRSLAAFANFYTLRAGPVLPRSSGDPGPIMRALIGEITAERPPWETLHLSALERTSKVYEAILQACRDNNWFVEPYFEHGNLYERIDGRTFEQYIQTRGKRIRKKLRWQSRKLERAGNSRYELVTDENGLDEAMKAYQYVYDRSWKEPEFYAEFVPRLIKIAGRRGDLRLGNLYLDDEPVATQLWFVVGGTAIMYKTAYVETVTKNLSRRSSRST